MDIAVKRDYQTALEEQKIEAIPKLHSTSLIFDAGSRLDLYPFKIWVRYDEQLAAVVAK